MAAIEIVEAITQQEKDAKDKSITHTFIVYHKRRAKGDHLTSTGTNANLGTNVLTLDSKDLRYLKERYKKEIPKEVKKKQNLAFERKLKAIQLEEATLKAKLESMRESIKVLMELRGVKETMDY